MKPIWVAVLVLLAFGAGYRFHQYRFGELQAMAPPDDDDDDDDLDDDDDEQDDGLQASIEVVAKTQVTREPGYLYFLRDTDVWRTPMKLAGKQPPRRQEPELMTHGNFKRESGYLYFLNRDGDVARVKRAVAN